MTPSQLLNRLYFDRAFIEVARIIGYEGVELVAFWEQAKKLGIPNGKMLNAVYELTRGDKREETPPRYELSGPARDACWQLLGPEPGHQLYEEMRRGLEEEPAPVAEPSKKARKPRGR